MIRNSAGATSIDPAHPPILRRKLTFQVKGFDDVEQVGEVTHRRENDERLRKKSGRDSHAPRYFRLLRAYGYWGCMPVFFTTSPHTLISRFTSARNSSGLPPAASAP